MAVTRTAKTSKKNSPKAFVNWEVPLKNGETFKSTRGLPLFQNPDYPNDREDALIKLAESKENGIVELTMKVRIVIAKDQKKTPELSEFVTGE